MKKLTLVLLALVLLLGGVVCYQMLNTQLMVVSRSMQLTAATERADEFEMLKAGMERQSVQGTVFQSGELLEPQEYSFKVYTLTLKNNGLIPARMVEVQLAQLSGDVLYYGDQAEAVIDAGASRDVWVALLSTDDTNKPRDLYITYYLWGRPYQMKFTYDG